MKIAINGIELDYRDEGAGLPVIFFHAFPLNQTIWDEQVAAIRKQYRVITFDWRGFGNSTRQSDEPIQMSQLATDARELLRHLSIEKAVIVGLSMGGYAALAFYRAYPDAVLALVLADTRATLDAPEARERRFQSAEKAEREGATAIAKDVVPALLGNTALSTKPELVNRVGAMVVATSPVTIAAGQRGMAARQDSTDLLAQINCPALVIIGEEDKLSSITEAEFTRNGIAGAKLAVIERAGHLSNMEQPEEFNRVLLDFLGSLKM
jgi:pimeloyl-ACP methyl ester carboxylesterase